VITASTIETAQEATQGADATKKHRKKDTANASGKAAAVSAPPHPSAAKKPRNDSECYDSQFSTSEYGIAGKTASAASSASIKCGGDSWPVLLSKQCGESDHGCVSISIKGTGTKTAAERDTRTTLHLASIKRCFCVCVCVCVKISSAPWRMLWGMTGRFKRISVILRQF